MQRVGGPICHSNIGVLQYRHRQLIIDGFTAAIDLEGHIKLCDSWFSMSWYTNLEFISSHNHKK